MPWTFGRPELRITKIQGGETAVRDFDEGPAEPPFSVSLWNKSRPGERPYLNEELPSLDALLKCVAQRSKVLVCVLARSCFEQDLSRLEV